MITQDRLRELLDYDQDTGQFTWVNNSRSGMKAGDAAGTVHPKGYTRIKLDKKLYSAHRLAWLYVYGAYPNEQIDHVSGDKADNRLSNLRLATNAQNAWNRGKPKTNSTGFKGVYFNKAHQKFYARITVHGKKIHVGAFDAPEAAHLAYIEASRRYFGEFAKAA